MFSIIQAAGWPIWLLIACSVVALALIFERLYQLRESRVAPPALIDEVIGVTRNSLPAPDVVGKLAESSVLGAVLAAGLRSVIAEPRITEDALRQALANASGGQGQDLGGGPLAAPIAKVVALAEPGAARIQGGQQVVDLASSRHGGDYRHLPPVGGSGRA